MSRLIENRKNYLLLVPEEKSGDPTHHTSQIHNVADLFFDQLCYNFLLQYDEP